MSEIESAPFAYEADGQKYLGDLYGDGFNPTEPSQVGDMVKRLLENRERGVAALAACVTALRGRLRAGLPIFCLELYGQTHHAFDNPEAGTDPHARLVHSPAAAARSRRAIAEFVRERTPPVA